MGCFRFGCIYQIHAPKMSALHVHGACSCTVVYVGGSYASGALSAFVRVSRHKTLCMYHFSHCFLLVFVFCLINIFSSSSSSSMVLQWIASIPNDTFQMYNTNIYKQITSVMVWCQSILHTCFRITWQTSGKCYDCASSGKATLSGHIFTNKAPS